MNPVLLAAREKLKSVTPLKRDCGRVCGAACCRSPENEETGMLLFPGEEEAYRGKEGWTIRETAMGPMAVCPGHCDRDERPLACRLFPLLPVIREDRPAGQGGRPAGAAGKERAGSGLHGSRAGGRKPAGGGRGSGGIPEKA